MDLTVALICLFAFTVGHGSFLVFILFTRLNKSGNRFLGLILLSLLLRVGKSILTLVIPEWAYAASAVGLVAMTATGPLLIVYLESLFTSSVANWKTKSIHAVAPVVSALLCLTLSWKVLNLAYYLFTLHLIAYLFYAYFLIIRNATTFRTDDIKWRWSQGILLGISLTSATFVLQLFIYDRVVYAIVVSMASLVVYVLSLWAVQRVKLFVPEVRRRVDAPEHTDELSQTILELFEKNELFIDPQLTLSVLAKKVNAPPYLVSKTINHHFHMSFPEFLIRYRIRKAEQLLLSSLGKTFTVEAIAYESGFSTLSAFYTSFKKTNQMTPAQYRKAKGGADMKVA